MAAGIEVLFFKYLGTEGLRYLGGSFSFIQYGISKQEIQ